MKIKVPGQQGCCSLFKVYFKGFKGCCNPLGFVAESLVAANWQGYRYGVQITKKSEKRLVQIDYQR